MIISLTEMGKTWQGISLGGELVLQLVMEDL